MKKDMSQASVADATRKRKYEKPCCEVVKLVGEEVLAVGCKFVGGTGPFGFCHEVDPCSTEGS